MLEQHQLTPEPWQLALLPQFLDMTGKRMSELQEARSQLLRGSDAAPFVRAIGANVHKIAGTAESFGFPVLGRLAVAAESLCLDIEESRTDSERTALTARMLSLLADMQQVFDAALAQNGLGPTAQ